MPQEQNNKVLIEDNNVQQPFIDTHKQNGLLNDISRQISLIDTSLEWANKYSKAEFPRKKFKDYRIQAKLMQYSLEDRCSIAAYGESQVGKSYLISSLLATPGEPYKIENDGTWYDFVNEINPSGGKSIEIESTGVVTRFTSEVKNPDMKKYVRIQTFTVMDIITFITDSYYKDVKINLQVALKSDDINQKINTLSSIWSNRHIVQSYISEDEVRILEDYVINVIGAPASAVCSSNFFDIISENIQYIPVEKWADVFQLLWNNNKNFRQIFDTLITEYQKLDFQNEIYVPFDAILEKNGTLMQIQWLDLVCNKQLKDGISFKVRETDVYDRNEKLIKAHFPKTFLSALTAEIQIIIPSNLTDAPNKGFLKEIDILDFPGARNRLEKFEKDIDYIEDMPEILRRGKVAYIFNKYRRTRKISAIMFCHHQNQKKANLGNDIQEWIEATIGKTPQERSHKLQTLDNISPLFFVATKFNKDLAKVGGGKDKPGEISDHWGRFSVVLPEIVGSAQWFKNWTESGNAIIPFQSIYPLRDFYWSSCEPECSALFDASTDENQREGNFHEQTGFPNYFEELKQTFLDNEFIKRHFVNPSRTWAEVVTPNHDGSEPILRDINQIAGKLTSARVIWYAEELHAIQELIIGYLKTFHRSNNEAEEAAKTSKIVQQVRAALLVKVATNPQIFGRLLDSLMISPADIRKIAKNIIVLKTEVPREIPGVNLIRHMVGIDEDDERTVKLQKLMDYHKVASIEDLANIYSTKDFRIDDIIAGPEEFCSTEADVIAKHVMNLWMDSLDKANEMLSKEIPFAEEVIKMFKTLANELRIKKKIANNMARYDQIFNSSHERLNAIADYVSLELNNFISTVGRKHMSESHLKQISQRVNICQIDVDLSENGIEASRTKQDIKSALGALDASAEILRHIKFEDSDMQTLRRLPLWDNFFRWQNLVLVGIILSSGISTIDPQENQSIQEIIEQQQSLYQ